MVKRKGGQGGQTVATFRCVCETCSAEFSAPLLSDSASFGEFIARGRNGKANAYLNSFEGGWDEVEKVWEKVRESHGSERDEPDELQAVIGRCLDPVDGEALSIDGGPVCPSCGSDRVAYGDAARTGEADLPPASFDGFLKLSPKERAKFIRGILEELDRIDEAEEA